MITRILKQVKVFDISAPGQVLSGHGYCDYINGITWFSKCIWESDEKCNQLLEKAILDWKERRDNNPWGTTSNKPKIHTYWVTVEENSA